MTSKVRPEVRRIGSKQFLRWVIIDDGKKGPSQRRFWNGQGWAEILRQAMLYAHKDEVLKDLKTIKGDG